MNENIEDIKYLDLPDRIAGKKKKESDFMLSMLRTSNISKSAKFARIAESTAHAWLKNGMTEEIEHLRKVLFRSGLNEAKLAFRTAIKNLFDIANDKKINAGVRTTANKALADIAFRTDERDLMNEEIKEIKEKISIIQNGKE